MFDRNAVTVERQVDLELKIVIFRSPGCQSSFGDNFHEFLKFFDHRDYKSVDGSKIIIILTLKIELTKLLHNNLQIS